MKNNRTFLEKLLDGAEVEWKPLKEIAEYIRGITYNKTNESPNNIGYKILRANNITLSSNTLNFDDIKVIKFDTKVKSSQMLYKNDILISAASGSREHVGKVAFIYQDIDYYFGGFMGVIRCNNNVNSRYLFHIFTSSIFQDYLNEVLNSSTINNLNSKVMDSFRLPIPPLPVQTKIVKILDALTALTSELTSELILRRKQYEYYREKLLSEEELGKVGFEWRTLEELVEKTQNIKWKNNTKTYRYIDLTSVDRENNSITGTIEINALNAPSRAQKIVKENDIIFATTRPTQQRVALISKEFSDEIASTGYCVLRANTKIVLPKWLFYFLSTINFKNYVEENQSGSAYPAISDSKVKEFRIPVPEINIQQSVIGKLDKFYSLTNSLLHGLPKEINNRKKQYSYYQKELLNFLGDNIYE